LGIALIIENSVLVNSMDTGGVNNNMSNGQNAGLDHKDEEGNSKGIQDENIEEEENNFNNETEGINAQDDEESIENESINLGDSEPNNNLVDPLSHVGSNPELGDTEYPHQFPYPYVDSGSMNRPLGGIAWSENNINNDSINEMPSNNDPLPLGNRRDDESLEGNIGSHRSLEENRSGSVNESLEGNVGSLGSNHSLEENNVDRSRSVSDPSLNLFDEMPCPNGEDPFDDIANQNIEHFHEMSCPNGEDPFDSEATGNLHLFDRMPYASREDLSETDNVVNSIQNNNLNSAEDNNLNSVQSNHQTNSGYVNDWMEGQIEVVNVRNVIEQLHLPR
jgi:hypothetical protein